MTAAGDDKVVSFEEWLSGKPAQQQAAPSRNTAPVHATNADQAYAIATLNRLAGEVAMAPDSTINHTLNECALRAYRVADAHGLDRQIVTDTMKEAVRRAGGTDTAKDESTLRSARNGADKYGPAYKDDTWAPGHGNTDVGHLDDNGQQPADDSDTDQPGATWQPIDLGPYLRGEITSPQPTLGVARDDGQRCLYRGREHAVIGETESGKSWFCLLCAAAEMRAGNRVVYIHFEEADPSSTVERLKFLGLDDATISAHLVFIGPAEQVRREWLTALMEPAPTLVVLDGVNEAMALHGAEIKAAEGASDFRRRLVTPFLRAGAAVLSCDHLPMGTDHTRRDAYGTVHKGNAIDGARFVLVNKEPFGRGMRGMSHVYLTKDRPGSLRIHGRPTQVPGKSYFGALAIDATNNSPEVWALYPPREDDTSQNNSSAHDPAAQAILAGLADVEGGAVESVTQLLALLRSHGRSFHKTRVLDALADLVLADEIVEVHGARGAKGYQLTDPTCSLTCSQGERNE
jgi:hypothetical protein